MPTEVQSSIGIPRLSNAASLNNSAAPGTCDPVRVNKRRKTGPSAATSVCHDALVWRGAYCRSDSLPASAAACAGSSRASTENVSPGCPPGTGRSVRRALPEPRRAFQRAGHSVDSGAVRFRGGAMCVFLPAPRRAFHARQTDVSRVCRPAGRGARRRLSPRRCAVLTEP